MPIVSVRLDDGAGRDSHSAHCSDITAIATSIQTAYRKLRLAALIRTVPGIHPFVYFVREVPVSTTVPDPGTTIATYNFPLTRFPD